MIESKYIFVWCVWYRHANKDVEHKIFESEFEAIAFKRKKIAEGCKDVGMNRRMKYL